MDADKMAKEIREQIEKQLKATGGTTNPQDILNALGGIGLGTPSGTGGGSTKRLGSGPARHLGSSGTKDHKVSNSTVSSHVSTVTSSDGDKTSTLTVVNGEKKLTVQDKDGKSIFDGSVTTDEQKNALTKEVKEILEKLENKADKVDVKVKVSTENAVN